MWKIYTDLFKTHVIIVCFTLFAIFYKEKPCLRTSWWYSTHRVLLFVKCFPIFPRATENSELNQPRNGTFLHLSKKNFGRSPLWKILIQFLSRLAMISAKMPNIWTTLLWQVDYLNTNLRGSWWSLSECRGDKIRQQNDSSGQWASSNIGGFNLMSCFSCQQQ